MKSILGILLIACMALVAPRLATAGSIAAEKLDAAATALQQRDFKNALSMYRAMAAENPENGFFWYQVGTAAYGLKKYADASEGFERAAALGYQVGVSRYNSACALALTGKSAEAIDALELAIRAGLRDRERLIRTDSDLDSIRDTPAFHSRILPAVPPETSRADGWKIDLDYLTRRVEETHYDPWRNISRADWNAEIARIESNVPNMKDNEIIVAVMQLVVRIGDGHTVMYAPREGKYAFHVLPVAIYDFKDGLYISSAHPDYATLVGQRLVRIGKTPADEAYKLAATVTQRDNSQTIRWLGPRYLAMTEVLDALGVSDGIETAEITVADAKGKETTVKVRAIPYALMGRHLLTDVPADWVHMTAPTESVPLWLRNPQEIYTLDYLKDSNIVYANLRAILDKENETLEDFGDRMVKFANEKKARALVIDVRLNNGGNNFLGRAFFEAVLKSDYNEEGRLFVITGRETFSACQNLSNWFDRQTGAIFAGEPTGSRPNFVGEGNEIVLPYSGLTVNASSRKWQDSVSEDMRLWVAPELGAEMTSDDYRNNRDPAFAAILEYLKVRDQAAAPTSAKP